MTKDPNLLVKMLEKTTELSHRNGYAQALSDILKMLEHVSGAQKGDYKMTVKEVTQLVRIAFETLPDPPKMDDIKKELGI